MELAGASDIDGQRESVSELARANQTPYSLALCRLSLKLATKAKRR